MEKKGEVEMRLSKKALNTEPRIIGNAPSFLTHHLLLEHLET